MDLVILSWVLWRCLGFCELMLVSWPLSVGACRLKPVGFVSCCCLGWVCGWCPAVGLWLAAWCLRSVAVVKDRSGVGCDVVLERLDPLLMLPVLFWLAVVLEVENAGGGESEWIWWVMNLCEPVEVVFAKVWSTKMMWLLGGVGFPLAGGSVVGR